MNDADHEEGYMCWHRAYVGISVLYPQLYCKPKTALKYI